MSPERLPKVASVGGGEGRSERSGRSANLTSLYSGFRFMRQPKGGACKGSGGGFGVSVPGYPEARASILYVEDWCLFLCAHRKTSSS